MSSPMMFLTTKDDQVLASENRKAFDHDQQLARERADARRDALILVALSLAAIGGFILFMAAMAMLTGRTS